MTSPAPLTPNQNSDHGLLIFRKAEILLVGGLLAVLLLLILALEAAHDALAPVLPHPILRIIIISLIVIVLVVMGWALVLLRRAQSAISGRLRAQAGFKTLALHDWQTGLPNRYVFEQNLPEALAHAEAQGRAVAVGVIDLDDFKIFNDVHGITAGDQLLEDVGKRLRRALPPGQFIGRLGADEFVLLLDLPQDRGTIPAAEAMLRQLETAFARPFPVQGGAEIVVTMSLGVALYPHDGANRDTLLRTAFEALNDIKAKKLTRRSWWHIAHQPMEEQDSSMAAAPYGETSRDLLRQLGTAIRHATEAEMPRLHEQLGELELSRQLLMALTPAETAGLIGILRAHFAFLTEPELTEAAHQARSFRVGTVHGLIGLPAADTFQMLEQFGAMLRHTVARAPLTSVQRLQAQTVLQARIANELQFEQQGRWQIEIDRQQNFAAIQQDAQEWSAAGIFPAELVQTLSQLFGIRGVTWGRPDEQNMHVVEFNAGCALDLFTDMAAMGHALFFGTRDVHLDSCVSRAWSTGRIEITDNVATDPSMAAMASVAQRFGVRSVAAIPVRDESDLPVAILTLFGSYPGQFSNQVARIWLWALQQLMQRASGAPPPEQRPISVERRHGLRNALHNGGVRMAMQPLVDLRSGRLASVEALGRIAFEDHLLAPAEFLPAYGGVELQQLFRRGLHQSLDFLARSENPLPGLQLSINLPPVVLEMPNCVTWIIEALDRFGIAPDRLSLELLELRETRNWKDHATGTLRNLADRGLHLVMDDLGSGYSGLQRLRSLPFDKVKIDQDLIHQALIDPQTSISFISGLVQMAHRLGMEVVAEGLETPDLIEMVAYLGVDYGQGYGLARPMPPEAVADWASRFVYDVNLKRPRTALGEKALRERERDASLAPLV